jgi:2-keto-4-pentenoate hydratase/2-oxohepta-3-ene-1,7-dioic acid hydratase in catechol pathway
VPLDPGKVIGVGLNYCSHALEVSAPIPRNPWYLLSSIPRSSVMARRSGDETVTQAADWDVEFAAVVWPTLRRASRSESSDMTFDVPELLSFCSWNFTLGLGDVILTGTPSGVGGFRKPPIYWRHGDRGRG